MQWFCRTDKVSGVPTPKQPPKGSPAHRQHIHGGEDNWSVRPVGFGGADGYWRRAATALLTASMRPSGMVTTMVPVVLL